MTDQFTITPDDLNRAIEKVERYKRAPLNEALHNAVGWCAAERDAWKTAFGWREGWHERGNTILPEAGNGYAEWKQEGIDGMALIRERMK